MPDTVQFRNGNQIINYYAADGRKMCTRYFTLTNPVVVPMGETRQWQFEDMVVDETATYYADNFEYALYKDPDPHTQYDWISLTRIHNVEGYISNPQNTLLSIQPTYCYYRKDHLGNNRGVWQAPVEGKDKTTATSTIQRTQYYPSGLPFGSLTGDNPERQPYKYNGKEFITMHGYDMYDYGMRGYYAAIMRFTTPDPLAEKYYSVSPYAYCGNNPVKYIDPDGRDINIFGDLNNEALNQLQNAVGQNITLAMSENGSITYTKNIEGELDFRSQTIVDIIDNKSVVVNLNAIDGDKTSTGNLFIGGAFMGNEVQNSDGKDVVIANQEINPKVLDSADAHTGTPGMMTLHEVTEAYQGALISQRTGMSSPKAGEIGSVYNQAHKSAFSQNKVYQTMYNSEGIVTSDVKQAVKVEWSVRNLNGKHKVIQTLK